MLDYKGSTRAFVHISLFISLFFVLIGCVFGFFVSPLQKKLVNLSEKEIEFSKRKGNLLITGSHGCGKSTIIDLILKEND